MTRSSAPEPSRDNDTADETAAPHDTLPCVLSFNASDPTGAGGVVSVEELARIDASDIYASRVFKGGEGNPAN